MQQINLFNQRYSGRKRLLSMRTVLFVSLLALAANLAAQGYFSYLGGKIETQYAELAQQQQQQLANIKQAADALKADTSEQALKQRLNELNGRITTELQLLESVRAQLGNSIGYSGFMRALAKSGLQNVWLTALRISGAAGQTQVKLNAATLYPALAPDYLKSLRRQALFNGQGGPSLRMGDFRTDAKGYLAFELLADTKVQP